MKEPQHSLQRSHRVGPEPCRRVDRLHSPDQSSEQRNGDLLLDELERLLSVVVVPEELVEGYESGTVD